MRRRRLLLVLPPLLLAAVAHSASTKRSSTDSASHAADHHRSGATGVVTPVADAAKGQTAMMRIVVDGSKTPDAIPDALAYRHFITALSLSSAPSQEEIEHRDALLDQLGLSGPDRAAAIESVKTTRPELDALSAEKANASRTRASDVEHVAIRAKEEVIFENARVRLQSALSTAGAQRFTEYVREVVKPRIVIFGSN